MSLPPEEGITPDRWVILEISNKEGATRRILSAWTGDYVDGNSWRLSSSIVKESSNNTHYTFTTQSGSTYSCRCSSEGLTSLSSGMYNIFKEKFEEEGWRVRMICYGDPT